MFYERDTTDQILSLARVTTLGRLRPSVVRSDISSTTSSPAGVSAKRMRRVSSFTTLPFASFSTSRSRFTPPFSSAPRQISRNVSPSAPAIAGRRYNYGTGSPLRISSVRCPLPRTIAADRLRVGGR